MKKVELKELVGGALQEQFGKSFEKVVENLQNPHTSYKNSREINIKLKFTQNERRDDVKLSISVSEKLAPQASMETSFSIGTDLRTGEIYATEYGKQCRGQLSMDEIEQKQPEPAVDHETGEILQEKADNVVDFRNMAAK